MKQNYPNNNPKVSIITVVFNGIKYIEDTIKSVAKQNYNNIEYIIVDGGSKDGTLEVIERYYNKVVENFVSERDFGLSDAMNKGAMLATGEWIVYLHSDDVFTDFFSISKLVNSALQKPNSTWVTGYLNFIDKNGQIFRKDKYHSINWNGMMVRNIIRHQATLVRREAINKIPFDQEFKYAMDYYFFINLWKIYGSPIVIKEYIVNFRLDGNNLSSNYYQSLKDEMNARNKFRKKNHQNYKLPFDYLIYFMRYLKIKFFHKPINA